MKKNYVITLVGGIGNIIQTVPFMLFLKKKGYKVYAKYHHDAYSLEICEIISGSYDCLIGNDTIIDRAIDKGNMLCSLEGKSLVRKMPEWAAWFEWHGFDIPENIEMSIFYSKKYECHDVIFAPTSKPSWPMKKWNKWNELVERNPGVAVVGLENDGGNIIGDFVDYRGKLSLWDLTGILKNAKVVVCEEGGVGHLSAALGVKTLVLFGGTDVRKNLPPKNAIPIFGSMLKCQPCQFRNCFMTGKGIEKIYWGCLPEQYKNGSTLCMNAISCEDVEKILSIFLS